MAHIPKRLRFYEDAAKVVQRRMVPNFKKSFERAVRNFAENCIYRWKPKYGNIKMAEATRQWSVEVKDA